jgi:5'-nucleotidase
MSQNRRKFIKQSVFSSIGIIGLSSFPLDLIAKKDLLKLTILHTNDVHSHIEPFPDNDPKYPGLGGVARRAALVKKIRYENPNTLLLDAGDVFQGTPYFNLWGGELEFKIMSEMGYDASTIGNHDFDNGLAGLDKMLPHAKFPFLCSNYDFTDTEIEGKTKTYKIFNKGGIKVGVFGLGIDLPGLVDKRMYGNTKYIDPVAVAAKYAHFLRKDQNCDLVICLSHLGYKYKGNKISDIELAKQSKNIDLIIGGHTHTFLDEPLAYRNSDGKEVLISQVGWAGIKLGRVDFYFKSLKNKPLIQGSSMLINDKILNS